MTSDADQRHESPIERLDRNWDDLLQELRVAETGVQLLTGLLLTVPFQARFPDLEPQQITVYLITVSLSVLATGLLIAPVVLHRVLFRMKARSTLVAAAQRFALAGFAVLGLAVVGVCALIFDVTIGSDAGVAAGVVAAVAIAALWGVGPAVIRARKESGELGDDEDAAAPAER